MPITKTTGYLASNGVVYATIAQAQAAEFRGLLGEVDGSAFMDEKTLNMVAADLPNHAEAILAILTTGPRSRPAARKRAGTTNPKRATKQQASEGFKAMRMAADEVNHKTPDPIAYTDYTAEGARAEVAIHGRI